MTSGLGGLSASELRTLAIALRSGKLSAPFSTAVLSRLLGTHYKPQLAEWLNQVAAHGCSSSAMALCLDAFADAVEECVPVDQGVQLVTTAPPGDSALHRDTAVVVQDLFRRARQSVLISTYGIFGGREIFQVLAERMQNDPALQVRLFVNISGHGELGDFRRVFREYHWPTGMRLPEVYYDIRAVEGNATTTAVLHAKCIVMDEEELFVTSANFTDAAHYRNVELGLLVRSGTLAKQTVSFFDRLIRSGHCVRMGT